MIAIISAVLSALEDEERSSRKCSECAYYHKNGFVENSCHIPECRLIIENENKKRKKGLKYDLFKALIYDDSQAENCLFFIKKENK